MSLAFVLGLSLCMAAASPRSIAEMYFASDPDGQNRVTSVQEGDSVRIVVYDADENIDCDVRDKIWTNITVMDPNTGASIVWVSYSSVDDGEVGATQPDGSPGVKYDEEGYYPYKGHFPGNSAGSLNCDYLEETGADTGLFVSRRFFYIGARESFNDPRLNTHVAGSALGYLGIDGLPFLFQWGHYEYVDPDFELPATNVWADERGWFGPRQPVADHWPFVVGSMDPLWRPAVLPSVVADAQGGYLLGRFENMDTLVGMYQDQNDSTDVATAMMKIIDTVATITWDQEVYADTEVSAVSATIIVADADENLNCNVVEYVPVFILVNPGSWNPVAAGSPTDFCALLATGGVDPDDTFSARILNRPIRWYNIYDSGLDLYELDNMQARESGSYYVQYPVADHANVTSFDTADENGYCRVMFYAQETGVNTGVFQLNMNSILDDLGFNSMRVRDVLVAYYLDPNDSDDMEIGVSYITEKQHSITSFTDATRQEKDVYWIGRDPVYVQVIDANADVNPCSPEQVVVHVCDPHDAGDSEWLTLAETSSNSPVFFSNAQTKVFPVWDPLGIGLFDGQGGYQLQLDNWKLEAFNEDSVCVTYNDVYYATDDTGVAGLGDIDMTTAFPPAVDRVRVANDVSFDTMKIADTQVYNGQSVSMYFLDRQGNRVAVYTNVDEVFIEVVDLDQNEDPIGRERIDAFWDGEQNIPFGPVALRDFGCTMDSRRFHPVNELLGDTNIFNSGGGGEDLRAQPAERALGPA